MTSNITHPCACPSCPDYVHGCETYCPDCADYSVDADGDVWCDYHDIPEAITYGADISGVDDRTLAVLCPRCAADYDGPCDALDVDGYESLGAYGVCCYECGEPWHEWSVGRWAATRSKRRRPDN
jgi:hypothetical protein